MKNYEPQKPIKPTFNWGWFLLGILLLFGGALVYVLYYNSKNSTYNTELKNYNDYMLEQQKIEKVKEEIK